MNELMINKGVETRKRIYDYIVQYITDYGYPPTNREICDGVGLASTSSVYNHLKIMKVAGVIEMVDKQPRCIRVRGMKIIMEDDNGKDKQATDT